MASFKDEADQVKAALALAEGALADAIVAHNAEVKVLADEILSLRTERDQLAALVMSLQQENQALKAENAALKLKIKQLEDQLHPPTTTRTTTRLTTMPPTPPPTQPPTPTTPPPPSGNVIFSEKFLQPLDPKKWIFLCNDPAKNFVWQSPGNLDVVFVAGTTTGSAIDSASGKIKRSEFMLRKIGQTTGGVPQSLPIGAEYLITFDFTIPSNYNPAVSDAPNEKRNLTQLWEASTVSPFALELIKPSAAPWNGTTNVIRLVAAGVVQWIKPVNPGTRYKLLIDVLLHKTTGKLAVTMNGAASPTFNGPTCWGASPDMVPHAGLYLPGSDNDPVGGKTTLRLHEWTIEAL